MAIVDILESYFFNSYFGESISERIKIIQVELELDGLSAWDVKVEDDNLVIYYKGRE